MFNKSIINLGLLLLLTSVVFANITNWDFVYIFSQSQDLLKIEPSEISLNKSNEFQGTIELKGIENFDKTKIDTSALSNSCDVFCNATVMEDGKIMFMIKETFLKTIQYSKKETSKTIKIKYNKESGGELEGSVTLRIPPRIVNVSIVAGNKTFSDNDRLIQLVDGEKVSVQATYSQDGSETSVFNLKAADEKIISISNNSLISKSVGTTEVIVLAGEDENSEIDRFNVTVIPAIKSLESKSGTTLYMSESSSESLKVVPKDSKGMEISNLTRVNCVVEEQTQLEVNKQLKNFLSLIPNNESYTLNSKTLPLSPRDSISGRILCSIKEKKDGEANDLPITVVVQPKNGYLTIDNLNGNTLLPYGSLTFLTNVYNDRGIPEQAGITYKLENEPINKQWVSLSPQGQKLTVNWVDLTNNTSETRPSSVNINVEAISQVGGYPIRGTITIRMGASVTRFSSLRVKLNVMDSRTASDLYGNVTNDEYYVLMVRLFNDLKDEDPNKNLGQSILAYSSSIEVAVGLEKQFDDDSDSGIEVWKKDRVKAEREKWKNKNDKIANDSLNEIENIYKEKLEDFNKFMRDASSLELKALELEIIARTDRTKSTQDAAKEARRVADAAHKKAMALRDQLRTFYQDNLPPLEPFTYRSDIAIDDGKWYPASRDDLIKIARQDAYLSDDDDDSTVSFKDNEPNCVDTITYRPFTFEMIVNTVDRRDERTLRSRIFKVLNFLSFGLSTVTAVAVPPKGSDLPIGIEKFGNVAIPGLEELFPNLKEQHRQNIVAQSMKPIEEIPFGSDLTRVIFIPKKSIRGLITGHKARISQLCPFYFKVKVAVITKGGEVTLGSQQTR